MSMGSLLTYKGILSLDGCFIVNNLVQYIEDLIYIHIQKGFHFKNNPNKNDKNTTQERF